MKSNQDSIDAINERSPSWQNTLSDGLGIDTTTMPDNNENEEYDIVERESPTPIKCKIGLMPYGINNHY